MSIGEMMMTCKSEPEVCAKNTNKTGELEMFVRAGVSGFLYDLVGHYLQGNYLKQAENLRLSVKNVFTL